MRKFLTLFLSMVLIFPACLSVSALEAEDANDYPVILLPGYSSSALKKNSSDGTYTQIWGLDFDEVFRRVGEHAADIAAGAALMTQGDYEYLARVVGEEFLDLCEPLACNPDGASKYDVDVIVPSTAADCCWANMDASYTSEKDVMAYVQKFVPDEKIYNFNCDFRMGAAQNAERLHSLILDIVATTGYEKVNIIAISHGGQVTGTYLSMYGTLGYVNNCVMCMPAMGGAALAYDILSGNVAFDEKTLLDFIEYGMQWESDYHWLVAANQLGFLDDFIAAFRPYALQILGYWGSIWDFVPLDYFDETVKTLDPVESAPLIKQTTDYHNNIMKHYGENLTAAKNAGVNITILAGSGMPSVTGLCENSDAIIRTADTTGAKCAPYGKRFSDGYICEGKSCRNPEHNHLSPSMEIDASCCWLPDNTWFVDGLFHGMELMDSYTMDLVVRQLLSKEPMKSVYDDAAFPQFHAASDRSNAVHAKFDNSAEGYVSAGDSAIIIRNTTLNSDINIYAVKAQGIDIKFEKFDVKTIKAGQSVKISFSGELPEESLKRASVTVYYLAAGSVTPVGSRTFDFTVMNGNAVDYDESKPYSDADFPAVTYDASDCVKDSPFASLIDAFRTLILKIVRFILNFVSMFA